MNDDLPRRCLDGDALGFDREQAPLARHAAERVHPTIEEANPRPRHEVAYGPGHEDLARRRARDDTRSDVHRNAADVVRTQLALARVEPGSDLEAERADGVADGARTAD